MLSLMISNVSCTNQLMKLSSGFVVIAYESESVYLLDGGEDDKISFMVTGELIKFYSPTRRGRVED